MHPLQEESIRTYIIITFANWWLVALIWHQQESPVWCHSEEGNLMQWETAQLWYSKAVRQPWDQGLLWQDICSALLHSAPGCTGLFYSSKTSLVFYLQPGKHTLQSSVERESVLRARGEMTYIDRSPSPWLSILVQIKTPNPCSLIGPKSTVLIGQNRTSLIGWRRSLWGGNRAALLWLDGGNLSPIG